MIIRFCIFKYSFYVFLRREYLTLACPYPWACHRFPKSKEATSRCRYIDQPSNFKKIIDKIWSRIRTGNSMHGNKHEPKSKKKTSKQGLVLVLSTLTNSATRLKMHIIGTTHTKVHKKLRDKRIAYPKRDFERRPLIRPKSNTLCTPWSYLLSVIDLRETG